MITWILTQAVHARENDFKIVLKDGFYGGLVGALVGGAILAFKDEPGDHLDLITKGAAIGVIGGVAFGLYEISNSMAELEDGKMSVGVPTPQIRINSLGSGVSEVEVDIHLFRWRF